MNDDRKKPSLVLALVPVGALIGFLAAGVFALEASPHLPMILGCAVAAVIGKGLGYDWKALQGGMVKGISIAMPAVLVLMAIGILIGAWVASGVVPLLVFYGLKLLSPEVFLVASCVICAVVSISTGSSWSTAGTVGVALMGVAGGLDVSLGMAAGAVVSGAYFGDKLSPLSDTTNLAAGVAEVPLFTHIRHMLWTTGPSFLIALALFGILGRGAGEGANPAQVEGLIETLQNEFNLTPWLFLAPLSVIALIALRMPALPAILIGAAVGAVLGPAVQGVSGGEMYTAMQGGYAASTGDAQVDELLSRGGLESMFGTIGIIICAMAFGGLMECTGMLAAIANGVLKIARSTGSLVVSTLATCVGMNIAAPDQYLSIVVPGRMYKEAYAKAGLAPKNLSRCLEDAGTLSSPLVPWNTCGAFMMGALGVNPLVYLPFAFFNLLCPVVSAVLGFTGWTMEKAPSSGSERPEESRGLSVHFP